MDRSKLELVRTRRGELVEVAFWSVIVGTRSGFGGRLVEVAEVVRPEPEVVVIGVVPCRECGAWGEPLCSGCEFKAELRRAGVARG